MDPIIVEKLIKELEEKGLYSNGSIVCNDEQGKEATEILDKYLLKK
jgi:hypothetical protein